MGGAISLLNKAAQPAQDGMQQVLSIWYLLTGKEDKAAEIIFDNIVIKEWQDRFSKVWDAYWGMVALLLASGAVLGVGWLSGKLFDGFGLYSSA